MVYRRKPVAPEVIAWSAGFFSARGSLTLSAGGKGGKSPRLEIAMRSREDEGQVLERFAEPLLAAGIKVNVRHTTTRHPGKLEHVALISGLPVREAMVVLWPYLEAKRKAEWQAIHHEWRGYAFDPTARLSTLY